MDRSGDTAVRVAGQRLPADLAAVLVLLGVTDIVLLTPVIRATPLRIPFGVLVLLVLPGYVLTNLLFPERRRQETPPAADSDGHGSPTAGPSGNTSAGTSDTPRGLDGIERVTLSVALSLVVVMATALAVHLAGVGISVPSTLAVLNVVILGATAGAVVRRRRVAPHRRFHPTLGPWRQALGELVADFDRLDRALATVFIVLAVVVLVGTAYTAAVPSAEERSSEFYLLTESETGNLTATDYPTEFTVGTPQRLVVGITNDEHRPMNYTVVIELQNVTRRSASAPITAERELKRFSASIDHRQIWRRPHYIAPEQPGRNLRLQYLLYRGAPPAEPTRANAYRSVHLWINVSAPAGGPAAS